MTDPLSPLRTLIEQWKALARKTRPKFTATNNIVEAGMNERANGLMYCADELEAALVLLQGSEPQPEQGRIRELAISGAEQNHEDDALFEESRGGHDGNFETCPHPDCLIALRLAASTALLSSGATSQAGSAPQARQEWQTMESAPQDGSWMLGWNEDCGCFVWRDGPGLITGEDPAPTHWRSLPVSPSAPERHT